jgi:hypothetical protein
MGLPYSRESLFETYPFTNKEHPTDFFPQSELNSYKFRSDEFKNVHNGKHILFSGCSVTYGQGLLLNEIWPTFVLNKIKNNTKCSGFYNLGIPGSSIASQVTNMFKYFYSYGNPDVIFYNITEMDRFYHFENKHLYDAKYKKTSSPIFKTIAYQHYFMLDQYCRSNNIKLYSFSWDKNTDMFLEKFFSTFYKTKKDDLFDTVLEYEKNNKDIEYAVLARDQEHFGVGYHDYWSNFIYNVYEKDKND